MVIRRHEITPEVLAAFLGRKPFEIVRELMRLQIYRAQNHPLHEEEAGRALSHFSIDPEDLDQFLRER